MATKKATRKLKTGKKMVSTKALTNNFTNGWPIKYSH